mmetsp:Transcript_8686/g.15732  ORF Transcript_8686/g.15732 Transcript_8686/m.15732 type:complete len:297 (-) Transcript_8686:937-1827(-)
MKRPHLLSLLLLFGRRHDSWWHNLFFFHGNVQKVVQCRFRLLQTHFSTTFSLDHFQMTSFFILFVSYHHELFQSIDKGIHRFFFFIIIIILLLIARGPYGGTVDIMMTIGGTSTTYHLFFARLFSYGRRIVNEAGSAIVSWKITIDDAFSRRILLVPKQTFIFFVGRMKHVGRNALDPRGQTATVKRTTAMNVMIHDIFFFFFIIIIIISVGITRMRMITSRRRRRHCIARIVNGIGIICHCRNMRIIIMNGILLPKKKRGNSCFHHHQSRSSSSSTLFIRIHAVVFGRRRMSPAG